jgi:hypothetical protein
LHVLEGLNGSGFPRLSKYKLQRRKAILDAGRFLVQSLIVLRWDRGYPNVYGVMPNRLGSAGATAVADAMPRMTNLTCLYLR